MRRRAPRFDHAIGEHTGGVQVDYSNSGYIYDYHEEGALGRVPTSAQCGALQTLYNCICHGCIPTGPSGADYFPSRNANCEGQASAPGWDSVGTDFQVCAHAFPGSVAIYRCVAPNGDHFVSHSSNCDGGNGSLEGGGPLGWLAPL